MTFTQRVAWLRDGAGTGSRRRRNALLTGCALVALALVGGADRALAQAGSPAAQVAVYAIPAGPMSSALASFGRTSGVQLVYDSSVTQGRRSAGATGTLTPDQALTEILAGSGLSWQFTSATTVTIEAPLDLPPTGAGAVIVDGDTIVLDQIIVSGEKLDRDLADVYSSVGVITGTQAYDYVIDDLPEALNKVANTRVSGANRGNSGIVIRGLSSDGLTQPTNSSPTIAVIVDGASQNGEGIRRGSRGTWDIANIEVFRGPQSTLQGRNAMGGAVVINTNDPTWYWEAAAEGEIATSADSGDFGRGAFMVNAPLADDQLAFRFTGEYQSGDRGITFTDPLNKELNEDELIQFRGKMLMTPEQLDGFAALVTVSHTRDQPASAIASGPDYFKRHYDPGASNAEIRETDVTNTVVDLSQELGNGITLRSVTAFIETNADIDTPIGSTFRREELRAGEDFTEDLRLELDEGYGPLSGVVGLNYGYFKNSPDSNIYISLPSFGLTNLLYQQLQGRNTLTSAALYADMRYEFVPQWEVLFGGRLGYEKVENQLTGVVLDFTTFNYDDISRDTTTDYTVALPKIGIAYDLTPNQTIAVTASEGFRAGFGTIDFEGETYDVDPEELWAYEVAYRSTWFDDRLEFNANGFYYEYDDLQIDVDDPHPYSPQTITKNIGKAHAYGAELEARARLTDELSGYASLGLLRTKFDDAVSADGDYTGNVFPEAPEVTFNLGGVYRHGSGLYASADLSYTGSYYSVGDIANTPEEKVSGFTIVNAAVGYEAENWSVTGYIKNIFDEQYLTSVSVHSSGTSAASVGDGRMFGVRARASF